MKNTLTEIFNESEKNFDLIYSTYKILEKSAEMKIPVHSAGQWILDNMYIIEQEVATIKDEKRYLKNKRLPIIKANDGSKYISIYYLAYELVEENKGSINQWLIENKLREHQKISYLSSEELNLFILMVKISLLKFIARVCENVMHSQLQKLIVEEILKNEEINFFDDETRSIAKFKTIKDFKEYILDEDKIKNSNTAFIEYMAFRLKEYGPKGDKFLKCLKTEAEKIGFSVDSAIVKEHMEIAKTTDYIGRAIISYKQIQGINFREIFERVNKADETLKDDYTGQFKKCDYKTKNRYRDYVIKLAKRYNLSEIYVAKKAVECSKKYKKHVGYFLIGNDKWRLKKELGKCYILDKLYTNVLKKTKPFLYVALILGFSVVLTLFVNLKVLQFDNTLYKVISYVLSFVFSLEICEKLFCYILRKAIKPVILPRFDFAKTIDKEYPTYVVMPTIISSIEKLDNMINKMEVTYLANRTENMYYMLIGDCMASDKKSIAIDEKILKYAKEKLDNLNKKYESDKVLFNFLYRKRIYSKSEGTYMGWERKRGALAQFNKLVLGKLTDKEKNDAMWLTYDEIVKAKYIITVDEDTSLSLNTAKDLVAIISHPLNKPVLSKNGRIIKEGYGLVQPSVGLDIESANKSIFSKIFGGFGGLDIYTTAVSNTYQDVFGEAIFCGKGIYDLEIFEKMVSDEIPENLVLSHDLLEGSIVRTGLASDIEVQDSFPNNYIAYMKRNHRWYRGDMQIIRWLINPFSKLNLLSKWKIFDNLRRPLLDVFALIAIMFSIFVSNKAFVETVLGTFIVLNFGYIISIINRIIFGRVAHSKELQYIPIIHGLQADLLSMVFNFLAIPYKAYMCLNAFITSLYRMLISHKHLLQWTTAETLEKTSKNTLWYYTLNMITNIITGLAIVFIPYASITETYLIDIKIIIGACFILAPLMAYLLGKDHLLGRKKRLNIDEEKEVLEVGKRTWEFFSNMMTKANNYLPTDNFQENRRYKIANRTSSTNVGFGILAIINAYDLKFITKEDAISRLENIMDTVKRLEKWHGHLYNWYNIKTLEPLRPRFVSTVDSGNFVGALYVLKEFLYKLNDTNNFYINTNKEKDKDIENMISFTEKLIKNTDFTKLYNTERNLFSIGYDEESNKLVDSYYDMLMSESRLTSLISIATRQVTSKHWFSLSRNLVKTDGYKGLVSWSGTSFEYFMPYLFNKSYEHTLIDQSLFFAKYSQTKYVKSSNIPWGISESAFAVKDNDLNYQYQAFGIPWLGLKRGLNNFLVISPYASLLMLEFDPIMVYKNIKALKSIGAYSSYGFYESIDYTLKHLEDGQKYEVVRTYMAHHQGMILTSINNYINKGIIKERFHSSADIKASEILLKERERMKVNIKKNLVDNDNVIKQKNLDKYTMFVDSINSKTRIKKADDTLHINFLKGHNLSTIITSNGASYLKYRDKIVNRQRFTDVENSGNFVFLTDKVSGITFSSTNADTDLIKSGSIKKTYSNSMLNASEVYIETKDLETTTTIFLSPEYNMEIKKVSMYNNSNVKREILINTYIEPAMTDYMTNVVHPSFSNLTIETYYDTDLDLLVASKRKKTETDTDLFVYSKLIGIDLEKEVETEKSKISNNIDEAYDNNIVRYPLWPVLSYRATIILDPHERQEFYYVVGVTESKYRMNNSIVNIDKKELEQQFKLTCELNNIAARYLELSPGKAALYNNIIKEVLFDRPNVDSSEYWDDSLSQSMLWKYSISGDLPILLVYINKIEDAGIITEVIKFMDYVKNRKIDLDIVVLINEREEKGPLYHFVKSHIDRAVYMDYTRGNIYILNVNLLTKEETKLISFLGKKCITNILEFTDVDRFLKIDEGIDKEEDIL